MKTDSHVIDDLPAFVLGTLAAPRSDELRGHLRGCSRCRDELLVLQTVVDRLDGAVKPVEPPAGLEDAVVNALPGRKLPGPWTRVALVAAMVLAVGLGTLVPGRGWGPQGGSGRSVALLTEPSGRAFGTMVVDPADGRGILAVRDLGVAVRYRLWVVRDAEWASLGTFASDAAGSGALAVVVPGALSPGVTFCVSADEGATYHPDFWVLKGSL